MDKKITMNSKPTPSTALHSNIESIRADAETINPNDFWDNAAENVYIENIGQRRMMGAKDFFLFAKFYGDQIAGRTDQPATSVSKATIWDLQKDIAAVKDFFNVFRDCICGIKFSDAQQNAFDDLKHYLQSIELNPEISTHKGTGENI